MLSSLLLQLVGLWLLSMAMNKHYRHTFANALTPMLERAFSIIGWGLLSVSFILVLLLSPLPLMIVYWVSCLALNITLVAFFNSYQENRRKRCSNRSLIKSSVIPPLK